ncbi:MAG: CARDB domain-containing protein [Patescibacteria group bacterium]
MRGNSSAVSWSSANTTSCTSTSFSTGNATSGTIAVSPTQTTSYDVTCTGPGGSTGIKTVTVTVTAPVFDASCSVNPTSAQIGETVTWSASAWNGTAPYTFSWIGQIIEGLTGSSASVSYSTSGVKTGSIQVTDSTSNGTSVSLTNNDNKICTGPVIASNITPGLQEDGGTQSAMQNEAYSFTRGGFRGGIGIFYDQSYSATYATVKANPQNYCIDVKLSQRCNPPPGWEGCNWSFDIDIHQGTGLRDPQASDQGPYVPNQNGFGTWNQARFFGAVLGTPVSGAQTINRSCVNSVTVAAAATTANLSANPISITQGNSSTLTWSSTNATSCTSPDFNTGGAVSGSISVSPSADTMYTVDCTGSGAPASSSVTVSVTAAQSDLTAAAVSPASAIAGTLVTLSALVSNSGVAGTGVGFTDLFQRATDSSGSNATDIGTYANTALASSGNTSATMNYSFPSAGTWYVRACADKASAGDSGAINESNEGNNCGPWTAITVAAAGVPAVSCTPSNANPPVGGTVTYTATPSGGAGAPFTWNPSLPSACTPSTSSTISCTFTIAGQYAMNVSATGVAGSVPCSPNPIQVGAAACGVPASATLTPVNNRVRKGTGTSINYNVTGGINTSCTIMGPGAPGTISANACTLNPSSGSFSTGNLSAQATYIITCDGVELKRTVVNIIPNFVEY